MLGVDDDVRAMAASLATGPVAAFLAVAPLASVNKFTLTPAQQAHALQVLDASGELARFRYEITKFELSDAAFWGLYFRHLERLRRSRPALGPRARAGADAQVASSAIDPHRGGAHRVTGVRVGRRRVRAHHGPRPRRVQGRHRCHHQEWRPDGRGHVPQR